MKRKNSRADSRSKAYRHYLKAIQNHRLVLTERYKVKEIGIFGSVVRGGQKQRSDIDILVDFDEVPGLLKFIELERYLEKVLKKKVDLVEKQGLRPQLRDIILNEVVYV